MYLVMVLSKASGPKQPEQLSMGFVGDDLNETLAKAEQQAANLRKQNSAYYYRVVGGKATHAVKPPEEKVEIVELKD